MNPQQTSTNRTISAIVSEAVLLAQDVIKNPQAVGAASAQQVKQGGSGPYTETITYTVSHEAIKKLPNGQDDITQLPTIQMAITNNVNPAGSAPTGSMHVKLSYSGEILEAYGTLINSGGEIKYNLNPEDAFKIAFEAVKAVKESNAAPPL